MKAVMYHYVREFDKSLPYLKYLELNDFRRQLDHFGKYGFISKEKFIESFKTGRCPKGIILTFDDGFKDHYEYVLPELIKRKLWGIFYVSTGPLANGNLLDVHKIHILLGKYKASVIANLLYNIIDDDMLSHDHVKEFHRDTYINRDNNFETNYVKRVLNYLISYEHRESVINELMDILDLDKEQFGFYMTASDVEELHKHGMIAGSHGVSHKVMSKLTSEEQEKEIADSFDCLNHLLGNGFIRNFCYPYKGSHTFTIDTEKILDRNGCLFSFCVEDRNIRKKDVVSGRQRLPRYDCNMF